MKIAPCLVVNLGLLITNCNKKDILGWHTSCFICKQIRGVELTLNGLWWEGVTYLIVFKQRCNGCFCKLITNLVYISIS
jgi:hypothetical protein